MEPDLVMRMTLGKLVIKFILTSFSTWYCSCSCWMGLISLNNFSKDVWKFCNDFSVRGSFVHDK